jgi:hypothetical protein
MKFIHFFRTVLFTLPLAAILDAGPVRFLPWDSSVAARKVSLATAKGVVEITDLHPDKRSAPYDAPAEGKPLRLVAMDRASTDGKPVEIDIKFTGTANHPLVIILPDPKHPTGLRPFAVDDDPAGFAWGSLRFINATGKALMVRHGKAIKNLPDSWSPVDFVPAGAERKAGVLVAPKDDPENILYSAVWSREPDVRKLVFLVPGTDVRTGAVELRVIPEDRRAIAMARAQQEEAAP